MTPFNVDFKSGSAPEMKAFRDRVNQGIRGRDQLLIKSYYLLAARASELCAKSAPSQRKAYGSELTWNLEEEAGEKALTFKFRTIKRKKATYRVIALPVDPKYEPWTQDLARHLTKTGTIAWPMTRQRVWQIFHSYFPDARLHSLRHWRVTHLAENYGFDSFDLTVYAGWTFSSTTGVSMLDTYLHLNWRKYFSKLLKPLKV